MAKRFRTFFKYTFLIFAFAALVSVWGLTSVYAEEFDDGDDWIHYPGIVTGNYVNVRTGAGTKFDQLQDDAGNKIQLAGQTEVTIVDDAVADDGNVWYKVRFTKSGKTYEGFMTSSYVARDTDNPITPSPTPSPSPVPTATATPVPDTEIVSTAPTKKLLNDNTSDGTDGNSGNSKSAIMIAIFAVIAIFVMFFIFMIVNSILKQNKKKKKSHTSRKLDRMRKEQEEGSNNVPGKRRPEIKRATNDGAYVREMRQEVYQTNYEDDDDLLGLINQENDDKKSLRAAVDRLQEHDIIIHKVYGEGEVYDNSDVKLMEVRFGNDVRFLNKDSIVSKKLVEVFDDEDQALARRRNKRKTTNNKR